MLLRVTFKTPDVLDDHQDEVEWAGENFEEVRDLCSKWIRWGEYLTLEIDTKAKTCKVVNQK